MKIIITGATGGIGRFLFSKFTQKGYNVLGSYHLNKPTTEHNDRFFYLDLSSDGNVKDVLLNVVQKGDQIVLINCAGVNYNSFTHKADPDEWMRLVDINLGGNMRIINALLPVMRDSGFGRIINLSSVVAQKGVMGTSAYAASKSALWGLTKSVAAENASCGITINCLNLGYFNTGMISHIPQEQLSRIIDSIPLQKLGNPENIFLAIEFLIKADYITGSSIDINGGLI